MAILVGKPRSSGGHWYTPEGREAHTQIGKNGLERNTSLRDARKLKLIPSVTTILQVFAKPGLERWKQMEIGKIAFDLPRLDGEDAQQFANRCLVKQKEPVEKAADFGTEIHDAIEKYFDGEPIPYHLLGYVQPAFDWKQEKQLTFIEREKKLVNLEHGFAGTVDIICTGPQGQKGCVDWKTRKTYKGKEVTSYDFQVHQIAAYAATYWGEEALLAGEVYGANCFISSTEEGRFVPHAYTVEKMIEAWKTFVSACEIWRSIKNYDPRVQP